jgi:hypothetical protein
VNGDFFPGSVAACGSLALSQSIIACLIASDSNRVLTGVAAAGKDDRHLHQCGRQSYGSKRAGLAIPKRPDVPKVHCLRNCRNVGGLMRRFRSAASQHNESGDNQTTIKSSVGAHQLSSARLIVGKG